MKTTSMFDQAWRDLINARRGEDIHEIIHAIGRLQHAARLMKLDEIAREEDRDDSTPLDPRLRLKL